MSTDTTNLQSDSDDVPREWRSVEKPNGERQWIHRETGVCVDLQRFARMNQMHTPETSRVDHYEFRLVVRPDGPGTPGECVDRTTDEDHSYWMALQWLRSHRDGEVDIKGGWEEPRRSEPADFGGGESTGVQDL